MGILPAHTPDDTIEMGNLAPSSLRAKPRISVVKRLHQCGSLGPVDHAHWKMSFDFLLV